MLDSYFQIDGKVMASEGQNMNLPKDDFREKYFEALDLIMAPMHTRLDQTSFTEFSYI